MSYEFSVIFFLKDTIPNSVTQHRGSNWSNSSHILACVVCVPHIQTAEPMYCTAFDSRAYGKASWMLLHLSLYKNSWVSSKVVKLNQERSILNPCHFSHASAERENNTGKLPVSSQSLSAAYLGGFCLFGIVNVEGFSLGGWRKNHRAVNGKLSSLHARGSWSGWLLAFKIILLNKTPKANQSRRNCL